MASCMHARANITAIVRILGEREGGERERGREREGERERGGEREREERENWRRERCR